MLKVKMTLQTDDSGKNSPALLRLITNKRTVIDSCGITTGYGTPTSHVIANHLRIIYQQTGPSKNITYAMS